jgi:hypothetical protein
MSATDTPGQDLDQVPNGAGAAAILAAGIGCAMLGILAFAGDASPAVGKLLNLYNPVGTLSGVTTVTIVIWLAAWFVLGRLWGNKTIALGAVNIVAFASLAIGLLLTFPPFMDLLQGK